MVEQRSPKPRVEGSSPSTPATKVREDDIIDRTRKLPIFGSFFVLMFVDVGMEIQKHTN